MGLPDIKQLKELLKVLRANGVLTFNSPDISLVLSETPPQAARPKMEEPLEPVDEDPASEIERLIDYSSRPAVEDL